MFEMGSTAWVQLAQAIIWVTGGLWALYLYSSARRGSVRVAIQHRCWLVERFDPDHMVLIVELIFQNTSDVLWRHDRSEVTLFDATKLAENQTVRLVPFQRADPFLNAYGATSESFDDIQKGFPFFYFEGQEVMLEPGEEVRTQLALPLIRDRLGLVAFKIWISGYQRKRSRTPYEWTSFFFFDPEMTGSRPHDTDIGWS